MKSAVLLRGRLSRVVRSRQTETVTNLSSGLFSTASRSRAALRAGRASSRGSGLKLPRPRPNRANFGLFELLVRLLGIISTASRALPLSRRLSPSARRPGSIYYFLDLVAAASFFVVSLAKKASRSCQSSLRSVSTCLRLGRHLLPLQKNCSVCLPKRRCGALFRRFRCGGQW